jgi:hypothetical protein
MENRVPWRSMFLGEPCRLALEYPFASLFVKSLASKFRRGVILDVVAPFDFRRPSVYVFHFRKIADQLEK